MYVHRSSEPLPPLTNKRPWIKWLIPLVTLPLVSIAVYASWLASVEHQASQEFEELIAPIRAAGEPLGDAWIAQRFQRTASSEGTAAWSEISMLCQGLSGASSGDLPIVGNGKNLRLLEVGARWEAGSLVDSYLKQARPLFDMIHDAKKYPTPVWQPLEFNGFLTYLSELQQSRQIVRLLQLDFEHAIVNEDTERALRDLQSLQTTAAAYDWDLYIVGSLVHLALVGTHYHAIQRSLYADVWSLEQLQQLTDQVRVPLPIGRSWSASIESEKVMAISTLSRSSIPLQWSLFNSARDRVNLLRQYEALEKLGDAPTVDLAQRAHQLETKWLATHSSMGAEALTASVLPAVTAYAEAYERSERTRKLLLTSLAVKRFQLTKNRWPDSLPELEQVGTSPDDWTLHGVGALGYSLESEGEIACVWAVGQKSDVNGRLLVPSRRPDYEGEALEQVSYFLTLIR